MASRFLTAPIAIEDVFESAPHARRRRAVRRLGVQAVAATSKAFINNGIPASGLFTGAEVPKTAGARERSGAGTVGAQFDPCYHLACDTFADNVAPARARRQRRRHRLRRADVRLLDRVGQRRRRSGGARQPAAARRRPAPRAPAQSPTLRRSACRSRPTRVREELRSASVRRLTTHSGARFAPRVGDRTRNQRWSYARQGDGELTASLAHVECRVGGGR